MNFEDYKQEIRNASLKIDNIEEILDEFRNYQTLAIKTLQMFHDLCESNHISYQLAYGSLLGAIRDNGQLPWDYDIDVFVPYEQKDFLINILKSKLDKNYYFEGPEVNPKCCRGITRIAPKGFNSDYLHVDIFFLCGIPNNEIEALEMRNKLTLIQKYRYATFSNPIKLSHGNLRCFLSMMAHKLRHYKINWKKYADEYDILCSMYPTSMSKFVVDTGLWANHCLYEAEDIMITKLIETRDGVFRIPIGADKILKEQYGDYRAYMPIEDRVHEMLHNYWQIKKYGHEREKQDK